MEQKALVILAGGSIANKYKNYSFLFDSPALVPISSKSVISFILDFYKQKVNSIYIVVNKEDSSVLKDELLFYNNLSFIEISNTLGVNDTLKQSIEYVVENDIIVNLATTIPTYFPQKNEVLIDAKVSKNVFYSGIIYEPELEYFFKNNLSKNTFHAFTGIFRVGKKELVKTLENTSVLDDLFKVVHQFAQNIPIHFIKTNWIDVGHEINYSDARKLLISSRSFNQISINNSSRILTKKSSHINKLYNEINYIVTLPTHLQIFYPRILETDFENGVVKMEYYGYPNLSEYQLYRKVEFEQWIRIFEAIQHVFEVNANHSYHIDLATFSEFYYDKTLNRVTEYLGRLSNSDLFNTSEYMSINSTLCKNFFVLKSAIFKKIQSLYKEADFCIMHGDFCFNNVIFDVFSNALVLIDPRGSFGDKCVGIYGDKKYDLAKLLHSTMFYYDYIVNSLFKYSEIDNEINYSFPYRKNQIILEQLSMDLLNNMNVKSEDIFFIVGLLFVSMCPLHNDNSLKQRLMYAHGLYLINKYID